MHSTGGTSGIASDFYKTGYVKGTWEVGHAVPKINILNSTFKGEFTQDAAGNEEANPKIKTVLPL